MYLLGSFMRLASRKLVRREAFTRLRSMLKGAAILLPASLKLLGRLPMPKPGALI